MTKLEISRFHEQYPSLFIKYTSIVHDRYIVIDYSTDYEQFYHCGASSKDAGQKICTIMKMYDKESMHSVVDRLLLSRNYAFNK